LKQLAERISQAEESPPVPTEGVNPYLIESVLKPLLKDEPLRYGDIDYDAFDDEDLRDLAEYCEALYRTASHLNGFEREIVRTRPEARRIRVFC
jgi:hypothetical protein